MLLYRFGSEGFFAVGESADDARVLYSDPLETAPSAWRLGRRVDLSLEPLRAPWAPGKIVCVGRNYREHAAELGNPMPPEPVLFLKAPSAVVGPLAPILLPPESERVEHEGEIAVVLGARLSRGADADEAARAVLGVTAANDVTARDLQRRDPTFARAKSFDTFCPLGPAIAIAPDLERLRVETRVNGELRQRGEASEMAWGIVDLLLYASRMMTLEAGDLLLAGTPAGVGPLVDGDRVEVEVSGVGTLANPVEALLP
ncbi:MAG: fumarylacetoacetate hydrolase family protein [Holophagales bacterium]|nr:fumarylacetoacetate hydrolase family protein [Holophagales bacterium]